MASTPVKFNLRCPNRLKHQLKMHPEQIDEINAFGNTWFHRILRNSKDSDPKYVAGRLKLVRSFLKLKEWNFELRNVEGDTILHRAIRVGDPNILKVLIPRISTGIDLPNRITPFHLAAELGQTETMRLLLAAGSQAAITPTTPFRGTVNQVFAGQVRVIRTWVEGGTLPLHAYLRHRGAFDPTMGSELIALQPEQILARTDRGSTMLMQAVRSRNLEKVRWVLDLARSQIPAEEWLAFIDAEDRSRVTALGWAVTIGMDAMVELIVAAGSQALNGSNGKRMTIPLLRAATTGRISTVDTLLRLGADRDITSEDGFSVIHMVWKHAAMAGHLVALGFSVDARTNDGSTPLHRNIHPSMVSVLVGLGADVNALDANLQSPLHHAVTSGKIDLVNALLDHGATGWNQRDFAGNSPLALAAAFADSSILYLLLRRFRVQTTSGWSIRPLVWAVKYERPFAIEALVMYGAWSGNEFEGQLLSSIDQLPTLGPEAIPIAVFAATMRRVQTTNVLRALGADTTTSMIEPNQLEAVNALLTAPLEEDWILEVRYRVYFSRSLLELLVDEI